jgi:hypothetical protein
MADEPPDRREAASMNDQTALRIKERERHAILQALRAGVVPRVGLQHIQVGRKSEVSAILSDFDRVQEGGAAVRFVVGRFGAGKSFFLNLVSTVAAEKGFLVARADITTDRRLHGSGGQAKGLISELMKNLASKARPEGGAMIGVVERWVSEVAHEVEARGGDQAVVEREVIQRLKPLHELVGGFDFASVLARYYRAHQAGDDARCDAAVQWLRAEFGTKSESRERLGIREIIGDDELYDYLKLWAKFARLAGYSGLLIGIDELVVLSHRLSHSKAREANYETILRILNDCLQGHVEGLMVLFCGTDECLEDRRRGLYSYEALATRLAPNEFARGGAQDLSGPVIRLPNLTAEDLFVLLHRIRHVHAHGDSSRYLIPDEGLKAYLEYCARALGSDYFRTPRDAVTRFVGLLGVLESDPPRDWRAALAHADGVPVEPSRSAEASVAAPDDDLVSFKL